MTVRSGAPDSVKAVGLKVYFDGTACWNVVDGREDETIGEIGVVDADGLCGIGGAKLPSLCFDGTSGGGPVGLLAVPGCMTGIFQSIVSSLAGTTG